MSGAPPPRHGPPSARIAPPRHGASAPTRPRVALLLGGYRSAEGDPFTSAFVGAVRAWSAVAELELFPLRYPAASASYRLDGAIVHPNPLGDPPLTASPPLWRSVGARVAARHRQRPFDLVFALQSAEPGFVASLAARRIGRPLVAHVGGGELVGLPALDYGSQVDRAGRAFVAATLWAARAISCGSEQGARLLRERRGLGRRKSVQVAPLPIEVDRFRPRLLRARRKAIEGGAVGHRLLCVADLNPVKDHRTLLSAFASLARHHPELRLDLVGGGPCLADLRHRAQATGVADRIRWWGRVPHEAVHLAFAEADTYVSASRHEGQGIALLEAAACGLPIATTPTGIASELPPGTAFLAPRGDASALASAITRALAAAPRTKAERRATRHALRARWSPEASAAAMARVWRAVAGRAGAAGHG